MTQNQIKKIYYFYLTKETKDQLREQLIREMNSKELDWEEKEMVQMIREKQKKKEEYQRKDKKDIINIYLKDALKRSENLQEQLKMECVAKPKSKC